MEIKGIITAMVTPFHDDESLDIDSAKKMAEWLIQKGVNGLFIAGTNGEFHLLSDDEKVELTKAVVETAKGRVPVIAGAGCCGTQHSIELSKRLVEAGASALSLVTPYYLVPNQEDLYVHFKTIAESVDIPFLLYNIPCFIVRYFGAHFGYNLGFNYLQKMQENGMMDKLLSAASILGVMVVGCMSKDMVWTTLNVELSRIGDEVTTLQSILDGIMPGLIGLGGTWLYYFLLKKKVNPVILIFGTMIIGVIGAYFGVLAG